MAFGAVANKVDKWKGKRKISPTKQQARSTSTSLLQARRLLQKSSKAESKRDESNTSTLSGKTKTSILKV